jgi:hypothetical protein
MTMSERIESERDEDEATREGQRFFDSAALNDALPESVPASEIARQNARLWKQRPKGDDR